jgi:hypothetical protein
MNKILLPIFAVMTFAVSTASALGDGGTVRAMTTVGEHRIAVFTSPTPLRAGPVDVSVLIQDAAGDVISNAEVVVVAQSLSGSQPKLRIPATSAAATNKLLQAAKFDLPAAGKWEFQVIVTPPGETPAVIDFQAEAATALPRWQLFWPWFTWPAAVIAVFVLWQIAKTTRSTDRAHHFT